MCVAQITADLISGITRSLRKVQFAARHMLHTLIVGGTLWVCCILLLLLLCVVVVVINIIAIVTVIVVVVVVELLVLL